MTRTRFNASCCLVRSLMVLLTGLSAGWCDTVTFATDTNTSLGTAQTIGVTPDLVIHEIPPNYTLASAQPVSPQYMASDALGSITNSHAQEFFGFAADAGDQIHILVSAGTPASQFPELLLYDNHGNLVAISAGNAPDMSSSVIDFTVPPGASGTWSVEVAGSPNAPNPSTNFFNYDLHLSGSVITYRTDVLGALMSPSETGFYAISANAGDQLHLLVSAGTPASQFPELLLYDNHGNLVAVSAANAPDMSSSVIDFTVPLGASGNWFAEVAGSPNVADPSTNLFNYDLQITGDTGVGPINPLAAVPEPGPLPLLVIGTGLIWMLRRSMHPRSAC